MLHLLPGVDPGTAGKVLDAMASRPDPIRALGEYPQPLRMGESWTSMVEIIGRLARRDAGWLTELGYARLWNEPLLEQAYDDALVRVQDIVQLEQIAGDYLSRERFLTELTLNSPDATSDQSGTPLLDEDYLILSTIHSAKGQEWKLMHALNTVHSARHGRIV